MEYSRRIIDDELDALFPHVGAIALEGAKGVGKTLTASQRAASILKLDDPAQFAALAANNDLITQLERPLLIDEWQLQPSVWDRVRRAVDDDCPGESFLLTGSATPPEGARMHSGAGRILSQVLRPLSISERNLVPPTVSLSALLEGTQDSIGGQSPLKIADYVDEILRSGFPGIRKLPEVARQAHLESYLARIVDRELPEAGMRLRHPAALRAWMTAYAAATSTDAGYSVILDAATPGESDKPARQTIANYREHLQRIFILDPLPAWMPTFAPLKRLTRSPKHHLVDPALAAQLVGVKAAGLLLGEGTRVAASTGTWLGALFESLVTQSIRVYAQHCHAQVGHLRTANSEREIDIIVESEDRRLVAIEVKLAATVGDRDVRHLNWLQAQLGDRVRERVVINTGEFAYRRPDGVAVVPLALLGV
jgi:predicted AAA+ superfamily ATPase